MKKKRQHFVYRKYLEAWSLNEQIWCLFNKSEIKHVNLINVGLQNYFYKIENFTTTDLEIAKQLVKHTENSIYSDYWVRFYYDLLKIESFAEDPRCEEKLIDFIQLFANQLEEEVNEKIEGKFLPFLQSLLNEDLQFVNDDKQRILFCYLLMEQFCRTNQMKNAVKENILQCKNCDFENVWHVVRHSYASFLGIVLAIEKMNYCLLKNSNGVFITCDQPVILTEFILSEDNCEMEVYYPLSPNLALLITKNIKYCNTTQKEVTETEVEQLNKIVSDNSLSQLYGSSEKILELYKV